eukprot:GDKI01013071.1.p2 GENE.GDKI01013071.1~~GDKI01013071.1.p2  ORF type:complete len:550 (-),score=235.50 GDKI01013071.1:555-2129(-)
MADLAKAMHSIKSDEPIKFPDYNGCGKCPFMPSGCTEPNPHISIPLKPREKILDSVLDAIGHTPMIRMSRLAKRHGIECELLAKCEFMSAGGSVKDRIGLRMVQEAEIQGRLKPGDILIEPTSGNTGIGLSLAAAIKGYRMVITLPEKMSQEKVNMMKALGAEILRTPTEAAWNSPESHIGLALKLNQALENSHILDQYKNVANPMAHYEWTAEEIIQQCDGKIDCVVMTAGTGGTISGIARKIKEKIPTCKVVGVDPKGSLLAEPASLNEEKLNQPYAVEGIGYDFIPTVLDRKVIDEWVKSDDEESFALARELIRYEGMLVGGSSGAAVSGLLKVAKSMKAGQRCVVLLPDSSRNYMSKFISDDWMIDNGFMKPSEDQLSSAVWQNKTVASLDIQVPVTVLPSASCAEVVKLMDKHGIDQLPVVAADGEIVGVVTEGNLSSYLASGRCTGADSVTKVIYKKFKQVTMDCPLAVLSKTLDMHPFVLVVAEQKCYADSGSFSQRKLVVGVVTRIDLLKFLTKEK